MPHRPVAVFALSDRARQEAFPAPVLDRLHRLVQVLPAAPDSTSPLVADPLAPAPLVSGSPAPESLVADSFVAGSPAPDSLVSDSLVSDSRVAGAVPEPAADTPPGLVPALVPDLTANSAVTRTPGFAVPSHLPASKPDRFSRPDRLSGSVPHLDGDSRSGLDPDLSSALAHAEVLITGWGAPRIDAEFLDAAPRLRIVVHAAGTVKRLVDPVVFERGIIVTSAAQANALPVAEYTMAALILGAKETFRRSRSYIGDGFPRGGGPGLHGSTVGIIGASRIGRLVLDRLRNLDVNILLADPYVNIDEADALGVTLTDVDDLCARSNLISLHAPALPETRNLIDARRLALMPDGAVLINTARGSLIDTEALVEACSAGLLTALLDVTDPEPLPAGHPLLTLDNVFLTPHLAGAEGREVCRLGEFATAEIARYLRGDPLQGQIHQDHLARIA
ncbi:MAG TPA: hydroxyacid dehydrogenase [Actinoplanes sp.]|nr:hydroxyacid dehydrogenase [Actinoplanes sp.]